MMYMKVEIDGDDRDVADAWRAILKLIREMPNVRITVTTSPVDIWDTAHEPKETEE